MARFNTALASTSISTTATIGSPGVGAFTDRYLSDIYNSVKDQIVVS
jgi:hypothetical protein